MFQHHEDGAALRLLVPLDGSRLAEAVLPTVEGLASRCQAHITLLHILELHPPATVHGDRHLRVESEAQAYLEEVADRLQAKGAEVMVHVHEAREQRIAQSVVAHTEELGLDLVVISAHGDGGLRGLLFGRIAQQVLQRGRRPVWLVQPGRDGGASPFKLSRILVPLDGTKVHEPALPSAISLARAFGAELSLAFVIPTITSLSGDQAATGLLLPAAMRAVLDLAEQGSTSYLEEVVKRCRDEGVRARGEVVRGDPVPALLELAARESSDMIVMASHGRTGLEAWFSGSVAPRVLGRVALPLLLVRAGSGSDDLVE